MTTVARRTAGRSATSGRPRSAVEGGLRLAVLSALVLDAVVHLRLADDYQLGYPQGIGGGTLFRLAAAAALVVAVALLLTERRLAYLAAALVLGGACAAAVLYTYVDVPAIGPVPSLYEPVWYRDKVLSAVVEGAGALLALLGARRTR
ncbi:MAG: hypothetical protein M3P46_09805 [Actinomycetota bacterium]|nr:hypothetical protein [Actinomycetota bacterium]